MKKLILTLISILFLTSAYAGMSDENTTKECDSFVYKLIPNSKSEIDKLVKSGIY